MSQIKNVFTPLFIFSNVINQNKNVIYSFNIRVNSIQTRSAICKRKIWNGICKIKLLGRFHYADINECLLNNGHGPCQDTCRNTIGGYECSCDGLQDTILSVDNHTCQDAGPCSVNNAGCSHTCLSTMGRVFCLCPDGFILEDDWKTCQGNRISWSFAIFPGPVHCFLLEHSNDKNRF